MSLSSDKGDSGSIAQSVMPTVDLSTYLSGTAADQEDANWRNPPRLSPACEIVPEDEYLITLPANSPADVYRVCGLGDERPCLEFTMLER